jgi:hypothetical protein
MPVPDERMPRVVVVTVRDDGAKGWEIDIEAPDLDPWQTLAYLEEAAVIWEATQMGHGDED